MALCMAGALLGMPALAAGDSAGDVPLVDEEGWTVVKVTPTVAKSESAVLTGDFQVSDEGISPQVVVPNGVRLGVQQIRVYPAIYFEDEDAIKYSNTIYSYCISTSAADPFMYYRMSPEKTEALLNKFKTAINVEADAWYFEVTYNIYTDGKGSYGKYFNYTAEGDRLGGSSARYDITRNTATQSVVTLPAGFFMPENNTSQYEIGLFGGFYYYSAYAKKELSTMTNVSVILNSAT